MLLGEVWTGHKAGETVSALTLSANNSRLVTADSAGFIKVRTLNPEP